MTSEEILYTILYALFYVYIFFKYINNKNKAKTVILLLALWMLSAISGVIYEQNNLFFHYNKITFFPYIYLFFVNYLTFIPLLRNNETKVESIFFSSKSLEYFSIIIIIMTIPSLLENIIHLIKSGASALDADKIMNRYENTKESFSHLSKISENTLKITFALGFMLPVLFFHTIALNKRFTNISIGLLICFFNFLLTAFIVGLRSLIVINGMMFCFTFFFYKQFLEQKFLHKLYKPAIIIASSVGVIVILITLTRFESLYFSDTSSIYQWILQYIGESHGNFNADMWYVEKHSYSDIVTKVYKKYFLGVDFTTRDFSKGGIFRDNFKCVQFYTTIGPYYAGYGAGITLTIFSLVSFIFSHLIKIRKNTAFSTIVLYVFYARIPFLGFMSFTYDADIYQLVAIPFVVCILKIFERTNANEKICCKKISL